MKLLIVDDEARIRALIAKYAAFEGYETEEAENGMQAIEMCRKTRYDLIIMDVMMPELDGFSAVREIRKNDPVPVIMLSARGEENRTTKPSSALSSSLKIQRIGADRILMSRMMKTTPAAIISRLERVSMLSPR